MPDFLPAVELAAKAVRGTLAYIGAAIDCGIPMRISQSSPAASAAAETGPEAVSARTESAAPASGHPNTAATPRAAATDPAADVTPRASAAGSPPAPADFPAAGSGSTLHLTARQEFDAADYLECRDVGSAGYCLGLIRALVEQVNACSEGSEPLRDMAAADRRVTTQLSAAADFYPQHRNK